MKLAYSGNVRSASEIPVMLSQFGPIGYHGLQLKGGHYTPHLDEPLRFLEALGPFPGAASALINYGGLDEENRRLMSRVIRFARVVGCERVIFCYYGSRNSPQAENYRRQAERLSDVGREAAENGIRFSLHNHFDSPAMVPEDFRRLFDFIKPGTVELTVDTAHLAMSGVTDIAGFIREFREHIGNFHLKDLQGRDFKTLGEGDIDFAPIFKAIRETGYDGWISADEESGAETLVAMKHCYEYIRKGLAASAS